MTKKILSLLIVFVSLSVIIALNCSGEATYDDGGGDSTTTTTTTLSDSSTTTISETTTTNASTTTEPVTTTTVESTTTSVVTVTSIVEGGGTTSIVTATSIVYPTTTYVSTTTIPETTTTTTVGTSSLPAPTGLNISNITDISLTISWTAVTGAVSYNIYQSIDGEDFSTKVGNSETVSYNVTGLSAEKFYYYKIKAVDNTGLESVFSSLKPALTTTASTTTTTTTTISVNFTVKIILDLSIDQVKSKTFADIDYITVTSGPGTFDKVTSANNVPDFTNKFYKPSNFSYTESNGVATASVTVINIPLGNRWVYFEAYEETAITTDKDITLSEQMYPADLNVVSTGVITVDTTMDSVYGDVGINLQTSN